MSQFGVPQRRTKTYVAFDGDADIMSYRTIQGWGSDPTVSFILNDAHSVNYARDDSLPASITGQLRDRLAVSKHLLLIVGLATNRNRRGILQYEIRYALRYSLPIFLVFKGYNDKSTPRGKALWDSLHPLVPKIIRDTDKQEKYCLIMPFTQRRLSAAISRYSNAALPAPGYTWFWDN